MLVIHSPRARLSVSDTSEIDTAPMTPSFVQPWLAAYPQPIAATATVFAMIAWRVFTDDSHEMGITSTSRFIMFGSKLMAVADSATSTSCPVTPARNGGSSSSHPSRSGT